MVKANLKIYPLCFLTPNNYDEFAQGLRKLEETTHTEIKYDFRERCFDITADHQKRCLEAETMIIQRLLPRYNNQIDKHNMHGTFEDLSMINHASAHEPQHTPIPTHLPSNVTLPGKPLDIHHANEHHHENNDGDEDEDAHTNETENNSSSSNNNNATTDGTSENMGSNSLHGSGASVVVKTFHISPQIRNIDDFLIGPLQHNMQQAVYLRLIPKMTDTICTQNGRTIQIEGAPDDVQEAYHKFAVIQKTFIGLSKKTLIACFHFHSSIPFRVYFCHLPTYRYRSFVQHEYDKFEKPGDYHVAVPVFLNDYTNEYDPPKDMVMTGYTASESQPSTNRRESMRQQSANNAAALDQAMQSVQDAMRQHTINNNNSNSNSSSINLITPADDLSEADRFQPPSWGLDREFNTAYNTGHRDYIPNNRLAQAFTPSPPVATTAKMPMLRDFPLLQTDSRRSSVSSTSSLPAASFPSSSSAAATTAAATAGRKPTDYRPSLSIGNSPKRRVLRIVPQKAAAIPPRSPTPSRLQDDQINKIKDYNYHNIKMALSTGLESVRGFKGELKLFAKIGKVLWTVRPDEVYRKIWDYDQIIDIVMRECGTMPTFTNMTTKEERIINMLASDNVIHDAHLVSKTAIYEFHCQARNSPVLPYKPIVLHMNQGVIDVRKVVLSEKTVAEVDWVSLDRRYDFKLALTAKHLSRCDVKPYTTFNKWVSVCPITRQMSFENVPNFLEVDHVIFKQTTRYNYHVPFIIDIIRVEKVPMEPVKDSKKINAFPGSGEAWYDFEIHNMSTDPPFKSNLSLDIGCEAPWQVEDILQSHNPVNDTITNYVKNLILLIERIENTLNKMPQ
ncbi:hypothetical protein MBANPS3_002087 [Mucor bainieri]